MKIEDLAIAFVSGDFDDDLEVVYGLYKDRKKTIRDKQQSILKATVRVGDIGVIHDLSPKYLNGVHVKVDRIEGTTISVKPAEEIDKWRMKRYQYGVRIPINCFKPDAK